MTNQMKVIRALNIALKFAEQEADKAIEWNFGYVGSDPNANYWTDVCSKIEEALNQTKNGLKINGG